MGESILDTKASLRPRSLGFFSEAIASPPTKPKEKQPKNLNDQLGFRSLAAAIVDNIRASYPSSVANMNLWKTLSRYLLELPSGKYALPSAGLWTPIQHLDRMRQEPEFIVDLARILHQIADDEVFIKHPEEYQLRRLTDESRFGEKAGQTLPELGRESGTCSDRCTIAAVANALGIPTIVRVVEANKELFKTVEYGPDPLAYGPDNKLPKLPDPIELRLEGKNYQVMLFDTDLFVPAKEKPLSEASDSFLRTDAILKSLIQDTKLAGKELAAKFIEFRDELKNLVLEGRLDKAKLLTIYIEGRGGKDNNSYLQAPVRQIGIEHGYQDFFERVLNNASLDVNSMRTDLSDGFDGILMQELVNDLARKLALDKSSTLDDVYALVEGNGQTLGA